MKRNLVGGVYKHYSGLIVFVLGVARHSETEEKFVCYIPLGPKAGPRITVRPYDMFFENVTVRNKNVPRFEFVGEGMPENLSKEYESTKGWGIPGNGA